MTTEVDGAGSTFAVDEHPVAKDLPGHGPAATSAARLGHVKAWRDSFAAQAFREGYALGPVFTDVRDCGGGGLYRLTEYLRRDDVVGVMVPDLGHLTHARCLAGADRRTVQRFLRAAVLPVVSGVNGGCGGRR